MKHAICNMGIRLPNKRNAPHCIPLRSWFHTANSRMFCRVCTALWDTMLGPLVNCELYTTSSRDCNTWTTTFSLQGSYSVNLISKRQLHRICHYVEGCNHAPTLRQARSAPSSNQAAVRCRHSRALCKLKFGRPMVLRRPRGYVWGEVHSMKLGC